MHLLVTRPLPGAWETKSQVEKLGCRATLAPLMEIVFEDIAPDLFEGASGIIATSQNGLRALSLSGLADTVRRLQVYAVGEATARIAIDLKLPNITAGRKGAAELVPVIAERHASRSGPLVHLRGDYSAYDLKGALKEKNIEVREAVVYRQVAAAHLPGSVVADIKGKRLDGVILMSPRTAEIWKDLAAKHQIGGDVNRLVHICLSDAVAAALGPGNGRQIEVAAEPNARELLSTIKGLAASTARG